LTGRNFNIGPSSLPKYIQISEFLAREIAAGRLISGTRLAPERQMAKDFKTSVITLRKALKRLNDLGLLRRIHGSGNYVKQNNVTGSVYAMFRLELIEGGGLPRASILDFKVIEKPKDLIPFGQSNQATRIRRLRYLNDVVIALEEIWIDKSVGDVRLKNISESLYKYYAEQLGLWISKAEDSVSIEKVPKWAPEAFSLDKGTLTGFVERLSWGQFKYPVEYSRTWFDTSRSRYVQRLQ
jgi:GntR family transcriptional regulator